MTLRQSSVISQPVITPGRRQSKTPILSGNIDQKSIETVFLIAICRPTGDKWQWRTLFLLIFDPHSSIVDYVFDCHLSGVVMQSQLRCIYIISPVTDNSYSDLLDSEVW